MSQQSLHGDRARLILTLALLLGLPPACGQEVEEVPVQQSAQIVPQGAQPESGAGDLGAARDTLVRAVLAGSAGPGGSQPDEGSFRSAIRLLANSNETTDRVFAGSHLHILAVINEEKYAQDFAREYQVPAAGSEFDAWALLAKGDLGRDEPDRARKLYQRSMQLWTEASGENMPRLRLRELALTPGTRLDPSVFQVGDEQIDLGTGVWLLFFSAINCGPCRRAYSILDGAGLDDSKELRIALIMEGEAHALRAALSGHHFPHQLIVPAEASPNPVDLFGIWFYPFFYVLRDGVVRYQGNNPDDALRESLR